MYELSQHARQRMAERKLSLNWLERALFTPALVEADEEDAGVEHRLVAIEEMGYRVLRVVCRPGATPLLVLTLHFDRRMKGKI